MVRFDGICHMIVPGKPRDRKFVGNSSGKSQKNLPLRSMGDHVPGREQDGPGGLCGKHRLSDLGEQLCQRQYGCGSLSVQRGKKRDFYLYSGVSREGRYVRKFIKRWRDLRCTLGGPVKISEEMEIELENQEVYII